MSSDNLSNSCDDSLVSSQRNSEISIPIQKRNSDVNFLLDDDQDQDGIITSLTTRHKGAIRAIRKLKYLVAKRKFKEALKPYDIKDVIESYSAGHSDLVFKVKGLQSRLDLILGRQGSKAKDVYESKTSLASRIVNVERMVDSIDEKFQLFIEMYQEDRKRFLETQQRLENNGNHDNQPDDDQGEEPESRTSPSSVQESNLDDVESTSKEQEEQSPEAEDGNGLLPQNMSTPRSLPQGIELFSIVSEQKSHNSLGFTRSLNSYL